MKERRKLTFITLSYNKCKIALGDFDGNACE
jgi:hypothetical protein